MPKLPQIQTNQLSHPSGKIVDFEKFQQGIKPYTQIFALTGAGLSADSGIPVYRNHAGNWQRSDPIQHQEFLTQLDKRKRYWARSMLGWKYVTQAKPNPGHIALTKLEATRRLSLLVTQNVDGLHQRSGSHKVIDLHGSLNNVICLKCKAVTKRADLQIQLESLNPELAHYVAAMLPDGDANIDDYDPDQVTVPDCKSCGGVLKPDVVFFGDNVPKQRVAIAKEALLQSDAMLVVGSSLQVFSGYRFCKFAVELGKPIFCINQGLTRADELFEMKLTMDTSSALTRLFG